MCFLDRKSYFFERSLSFKPGSEGDEKERVSEAMYLPPFGL